MQSGLFIIILVVQSERLMCVPIDPCARAAGRVLARGPGGGGGGGGAVISLGYRCGWCGNKRGIYSSLLWLLWKTSARGVAAFVGVPLK